MIADPFKKAQKKRLETCKICVAQHSIQILIPVLPSIAFLVSPLTMAYEVGKPISVELIDGTVLRGFVHAEDKSAGLVSLELIPSADLTLIPTKNVKNVSAIANPVAKRKWPSNREYPSPLSTALLSNALVSTVAPLQLA